MENDVIDIRNKYASGKISQYKLAKLHDVSRSCIQGIVTKNTWKHI